MKRIILLTLLTGLAFAQQATITAGFDGALNSVRKENDFIVPEGNTPKLTITVYDAIGGTPVDVTGWAATLNFSKFVRSTGATEGGDVLGAVDGTPTTGKIHFQFDATDSSLPGTYTYDIKATTAASEPITFFYGDMTVTDDVNATNVNNLGTLYISRTVTSAGDPTVNDDSGDGYENGTLWVNTGDWGKFLLVDNTLGAANWDELGGGVSDHGALSGLADDDHPQYAETTDIDTAAEINTLTTDEDFLVDSDVATIVQAYSAALTAIAGLSPAKGTIIVYNGSAWVALAVGTNGQRLEADSTEASGLKWETPTPGGVTDHGALSGLSDDDHPQYVNATGTETITDYIIIDMTSDNIPLRLQAHSTMTSDHFVIEDSAGVDMFTVDANGHVGIKRGNRFVLDMDAGADSYFFSETYGVKHVHNGATTIIIRSDRTESPDANGWELLSHGSDYDDPILEPYGTEGTGYGGDPTLNTIDIAFDDEHGIGWIAEQGSTANTTPIQLMTVDLPNNETWLVVATIIGRNGDDSAIYIRSALVEDVGGTVSIIGGVNDIHVQEDDAGLDGTMDTSGGNLRATVTGLTGTTNWSATFEFKRLVKP